MLKENINNGQRPTANGQHAKTHLTVEVNYKQDFYVQAVPHSSWNLDLLNQVDAPLKNKQDYRLFYIETKSKISNKTHNSQPLQNNFLAKHHNLNEFLAGIPSVSMKKENQLGKDFKQNLSCVLVRKSPLKFKGKSP